MVILTVVVEVTVLHRHHGVIVEKTGIHHFHEREAVLMFEVSLASLSRVKLVVSVRERTCRTQKASVLARVRYRLIAYLW